MTSIRSAIGMTYKYIHCISIKKSKSFKVWTHEFHHNFCVFHDISIKFAVYITYIMSKQFPNPCKIIFGNKKIAAEIENLKAYKRIFS